MLVTARLLLPARGEKVGMRGPLRWAQTTRLRIAERPPHPRFARPLPARGERFAIASRSRSAFAREFCQTAMSVARMERSAIRGRLISLSIAPGFHFVSSGLRRKEGKQNAERRVSSNLRTLRVRPRAKRRALACRRSTAALAAANERRRSAPVNALPERELGRNGCYPLPALPVQRVSPQAGRRAGRAYYPGAARERR